MDEDRPAIRSWLFRRMGEIGRMVVTAAATATAAIGRPGETREIGSQPIDAVAGGRARSNRERRQRERDRMRPE